MRRFRVSSHMRNEVVDGVHRFEHWYRDNTVYFITAKCRDAFHAFASEEAKLVFWDRFVHYTALYGFIPWVTTVLGQPLPHLKVGANFGPMMQRIHGSVAKLVNDLLPERRVPFWKSGRHNDYFDGCIRDEVQCRRAYRYTLTQGTRHRLCRDHRDYPHTRVGIELETGVARALQLHAYLLDVPYPRYDSRRPRR